MLFRSGTSVKLTWDATPGATSYEVIQYINKDWAVIGITSSATYTVKNLMADTAYAFRVRAVNSAGTSKPTPIINVKTLPVPPTIPTGLDGTVLSSTSAKLDWTAVSGAMSYEVMQYINKTWTVVGTSTLPTYTVNNLTQNTTYAFTVKAVNSAGKSSQTPYINVTTLINPLPPQLAAAALESFLDEFWM